MFTLVGGLVNHRLYYPLSHQVRHNAGMLEIRRIENPSKSQAVIAKQQLILLRRVTSRGKIAHSISTEPESI